MMLAEFGSLIETHGNDAIIIFESGNAVVASQGFTRAATWFQRH